MPGNITALLYSTIIVHKGDPCFFINSRFPPKVVNKDLMI